MTSALKTIQITYIQMIRGLMCMHILLTSNNSNVGKPEREDVHCHTGYEYTRYETGICLTVVFVELLALDVEMSQAVLKKYLILFSDINRKSTACNIGLEAELCCGSFLY